MHFGLLTAGDMILVNEEGVAIGGNTTRPANAAGFLIHSVIHQTRPDVHAACHFHSRFGKAWSAFGRPLEMINQDVAIFYGDAQAVYADFGGVVFKKEEALSLAKALGPAKGMILQNHGLITVGGTVDEAAYLYTLMERSCEVQLLAEAAAANGIPKRIISEEAAKYTYEATSDPVSPLLGICSSSFSQSNRKHFTASSSQISSWKSTLPTGSLPNSKSRKIG